MPKVFYDTEFIDDGRTIDLISIGLVTDTGDEFYRISSEFDQERAQDHPFVSRNVLPHLPGTKLGGGQIGDPGTAWWLDTDERVVTREQLRTDLSAWLWRVGGGSPELTLDPTEPDIRLWAWYSAYDHVALAQLFGPMVAMPSWLPKWTGDLRQRCEDLRITSELRAEHVPANTGEHDALADARWNRDLDAWIERSFGVDWWFAG